MAFFFVILAVILVALSLVVLALALGLVALGLVALGFVALLVVFGFMVALLAVRGVALTFPELLGIVANGMLGFAGAGRDPV